MVDYKARTRAIGARLVLLGLGALATAIPAHAGLIDVLASPIGLFSKNSTAGAQQRSWPVREFTSIQLVAREARSEENEHPASVKSDMLVKQLTGVEVNTRGVPHPLFEASELNELAVPLSQALAAATPGDDVLLLSSSRREGGVLGSRTAVTARLFVREGRLQFIAHDVRLDFYDAYRGTQRQPRFMYGSRGSVSNAVLLSSDKQPRPDWVSLPISTSSPSKPVVEPTEDKGAGADRSPAVARPDEANSIERRLETLQRLRERSLITEDEYRQKRQELIRQL